MTVMFRRFSGFSALVLLLVACAAGGQTEGVPGELRTMTADQFVAEIQGSEVPLVVNLWASWCIPCRSEAPLLREAHAVFGDRVRFLGVATEDVPANSLAFIAEFGLVFENVSDRSADIRGWLGAAGLPVTVFIRPGGEILRTHYGVIDDQALALGIDDLLAG
jgi:thiol-disulfide isomerase/thioredoxin